LNGPDGEAGRIKRNGAGLGKRRLPGASLLDLHEHRREFVPYENQPVAVASPHEFTAASVVAHCHDRRPGFDPGDF
jgi:hypothetical protein